MHGCSPYSISSMTLPRRQRTTWSRLSQRWIRLYKNSSATIGNSATTDAGNSSNNANAGDARSRIISLIADALFPASESSQTSESSASAAIRELMLNPTATSLDYMPAIDVLRAHGLTICR